MTTKPTAPRFRIRKKTTRPPSQPRGSGGGHGGDDGFGDVPFPGSAKAEAQRDATADITEIRREGLTGRQLRMARRLAQKHGLQPASDFDAVRLLRAQGIDPFDRASMLELVVPDPDTTADEAGPKAGARETLPEPVDTPKPSAFLPGHPAAADIGGHDLERIQRDIARRRRRKLIALGARLFAFVLVPTALAAAYWTFVATPKYATQSEFVIEQADSQGATGGLLSGTSFASSQDSIVVQDFLQSREAMLRLDEDLNFRAHFSAPTIDWWQRVPADASNEALYKHFQRSIEIGYDPTEGVIRMEVQAHDPATSQAFSEALIGYAEERIDGISERKRNDQMRGARESFQDAEIKMVEAQQNVLTLQEQVGILDPASETASLMGQIGNFETQLAEKRLTLQGLLDNARPNQARVSGTEGDIIRLEALIADLRSELTQATAGQGSLAQVSARLRMAEIDLQTRTAMMQQALQQMETARIEAERQVRYLLVGIAPIPPDVPTSPNVLNNTIIAFLIFAGIYLMASLTVAVLREQVSS